jgi:hypothetical protein
LAFDSLEGLSCHVDLAALTLTCIAVRTIQAF